MLLIHVFSLCLWQIMKSRTRSLGKLVTCSVYLADISPSFHCGGCKWQVNTCFRNLSPNISICCSIAAIHLLWIKQTISLSADHKFKQRFCYKANNQDFFSKNYWAPWRLRIIQCLTCHQCSQTTVIYAQLASIQHRI